MTGVFHALIESEFTQRAALTLAHALWQGLLVAMVLGIGLRWLRTATAATRHAVACAALLALLAGPMVTFCCLDRPLPRIEDGSMSSVSMESYATAPARGAATNVGATSQLMPFPNDGATEVAMSPTLPWHAWAVAFWMGGMMVLTVWHGMGWVQLQRLRREGVTPWTDDFGTLASRLAGRLGLHAIPRVLWSDRIGGPVAFGCWQAVVLMPASLATGFTMRQIEMILAHEFAHLRRHDYLINLCQTMAATLMFFHPAVWWINRVIRREREHACDDLAVAAVGDAPGYARALVSLAEQELTGAPALATAAMSSKGSLRRRVERLLSPPPSGPGSRFWPAIFMLAFVALGWQTLPTQPSEARGAVTDASEAPLRGDIRDRNGVVLATNDKVEAQIWFLTRDVAIAYAEAHGGTFPRTKRVLDSVISDDREVPDIAEMFRELVIPKLNAANLPQPPNPEKDRLNEFVTKAGHVVDLIQPYSSTALKRSYQGNEGLPAVVPPEEAQNVLSKYGNDPWCYRKGLTPEEEKRAREIAALVPGMSVHIKKWRHYPFGALAGHVLGYVTQHWPQRGMGRPEDETGVFGVEKTQDAKLRAASADNGKGPSRGSDIFLTLDARHQTVVEQTLRDGQLGRAAAVLMEVDTGDVLAMASVPSFDPNDFIPSISLEKFDEYKNNETHPLLNRAVLGFTPGSTLSMATSLAAILSGHENEQYKCTGGIDYDGRTFMCWTRNEHGSQDLRQALMNQCLPYFYQLGNAVGMEAMEKTAQYCGLGSKTGLELEEESGDFFPTREWRASRKLSPPTQGDIANLSVGNGRVQATPLQLARLAATVANGGSVWKPRLVDRIAPAGDASKPEVLPRVRTADLREHGLTDSGLAALRGGLEDVVHSKFPRASSAQSPVIRIAGVTGTAQNWRMVGYKPVEDNHTWFVCYAPAEKPRWALAVLVQGGVTGGGSASPIARRIMDQVSAIEAGTLKVEPKAMNPVKGNFDPVSRPFSKQPE